MDATFSNQGMSAAPAPKITSEEAIAQDASSITGAYFNTQHTIVAECDAEIARLTDARDHLGVAIHANETRREAALAAIRTTEGPALATPSPR